MLSASAMQSAKRLAKPWRLELARASLSVKGSATAESQMESGLLTAHPARGSRPGKARRWATAAERQTSARGKPGKWSATEMRRGYHPGLASVWHSEWALASASEWGWG